MKILNGFILADSFVVECVEKSLVKMLLFLLKSYYVWNVDYHTFSLAVFFAKLLLEKYTGLPLKNTNYTKMCKAFKDS